MTRTNKNTVQKQNIVTPKGELSWVTIAGQGKENFDGDGFEYTATITLSEDEADKLEDEIEDYYQKSGGRAESVPNKIFREDADGNPTITFKTQVVFENGKQSKVKTVDGHNKEFELPEEVGIGNGSIGKLSGTLSYFTRKSSDGVSFFLNSIKILKLEKYVAETGFEYDEDEDGGFSADDLESGYNGDGEDVDDEPEAKPKRSRSRSRKSEPEEAEAKPKRSRRSRR